CRLGNEVTYVYSANPALHAGTYAYGRYQNGKRTMGIGLPADAIDWQVVAAWANTCDANGWAMFGVLYEPGNRWDNLKDICAAGSAEPIPGAVLSFRYDAPAVALDTITAEDNAGEDDSVVAQQSYRDRVNTVLPSYRSPNHNWEMVQAAEVQVSSYVTEDGEVRQVEWPFNFVKGVNQATQLAAYRLVNSRELNPIELHCKPRLRAYRPGDCLHIDRPDLGLDIDAIVLAREFDPATMTVKLTLMGETPAKHAYALGQTGAAPDTPALGQSGQERDETAANADDRQVAVDVVRVRTFSADYAGIVPPGLLPACITPTVRRGGVDIRTSDAASYSIAASGVVATVNNTNGSPEKGIITITDPAALEGRIDLTVSADGVAYVSSIVIRKEVGLPPGFGGSGSKVASDNSFEIINGTSFEPITDTLTVTVESGESLYGTAPLTYNVEGTAPGGRVASGKWQYSPAGAGIWTDFGPAIVGELASGGVEPEPGWASFTHSVSGLSAGDYDVRLVAALNLSGRNVIFTGIAT